MLTLRYSRLLAWDGGGTLEHWRIATGGLFLVSPASAFPAFHGTEPAHRPVCIFHLESDVNRLCNVMVRKLEKSIRKQWGTNLNRILPMYNVENGSHTECQLEEHKKVITTPVSHKFASVIRKRARTRPRVFNN